MTHEEIRKAHFERLRRLSEDVLDVSGWQELLGRARA